MTFQIRLYEKLRPPMKRCLPPIALIDTEHEELPVKEALQSNYVFQRVGVEGPCILWRWYIIFHR